MELRFKYLQGTNNSLLGIFVKMPNRKTLYVQIIGQLKGSGGGDLPFLTLKNPLKEKSAMNAILRVKEADSLDPLDHIY